MKSIRTIVILLIFIVLTCAKQGFPPGGAEDRIPPEVVRTIPESGTTLIDPHTSIQVWFSEGIQSSSASDAIFITPYPGEGVKYKWRGSRCKITFSQPMKPDRTYVITFGTGIRDYRNNGMKASFTLAFSTGSVLDEGEIAGKVYGVSDGRGIDVWAYEIKDGFGPDPTTREPDYIVQCETGGEFTFSHIAPVLYRLFAVRDKASDRLYQSGEDEVGVAYRDVLLSREGPLKADNLYFRMTKEDTLGPSLIRAVPSDRHHLILQFDEPISSKNILASHSIMIVSEEDSIDTLFVHQAYIDPMNVRILHALTRPQVEGKAYRISVKSLWDEAGNPVDAEYGEALFEGVGDLDTIPPVLVHAFPQPGDEFVGLDGSVRLVFSEAIDSLRFGDGFSLKDTLGQSVGGTFRWMCPSEVVYLSTERLVSRSMYEVNILGTGVADLAGNPLADTLYQFQTLNEDTLSEINGVVLDPDSGGVGPVHIIARQVDNPKVSYTLMISEPGSYRLLDVLPGQYLLECFQDQNRDGKYSFGKPFPYQPSERFVVYQDTVRVRSRWPNEGNDLKLL